MDKKHNGHAKSRIALAWPFVFDISIAGGEFQVYFSLYGCFQPIFGSFLKIKWVKIPIKIPLTMPENSSTGK